MPLKKPEEEGLAKTLLNYYPSREALAQMVRYQLDESLDNIAPQDMNLAETVFSLVEWANSQGRTAELIRASHQANPASQSLQDFVGSLSRSTRQDEKTVPPSSPAISASLRNMLIDAMLLIPGVEDFKIRSQLLIGIPWLASLPRHPDTALDDLSSIVKYLDSLGKLSSGAWPLIILADNALAFAEGTQEAEQALVRVYKRLMNFYKSK
jgi:hypothetical protein